MTALSGVIASLTTVGVGLETTGEKEFVLALGAAVLSLHASADAITNTDAARPREGWLIIQFLMEVSR
jgi:hypothetical protein